MSSAASWPGFCLTLVRNLRSRAGLMRQVLYRAIDLTVVTLIFTAFIGG
jgi:hypothetical protein